MTINTGAIGLALWPGMEVIWGLDAKEYPAQYTDLFEVRKSSKNREELMSYVGTGLLSVKPQGQPIDFDSMRQGFRTRVSHVTYALGFAITHEAIADNLYKEIATYNTKALAKSARVTRETNGALFYDRAFNSSYTFGDGLEMCSTVHPNVSGGTYRNELATAADFSQAAIEQALIDIDSWTDDRGLQQQVKAKKLIVPKELRFDVMRVLNSPLQSNTAENAVNVVRSVFENGWAVNNYLSDPDAFFIRTDVMDGPIHFEREAYTFDQDKDFTTRNLRYICMGRYSFTLGDPKGVFGSPGA